LKIQELSVNKAGSFCDICALAAQEQNFAPGYGFPRFRKEYSRQI
jgi:hypothetical protein